MSMTWGEAFAIIVVMLGIILVLGAIASGLRGGGNGGDSGFP
jgi:hypothetical protein